MSTPSDELPLAGLRVLDLASFIAAPVAATVLGDYGADVIKVEPPGTGDPNRSIISLASYPKSEVNYPWAMDSRGKRSIVIDLKTAAGREVLYKLVAGADVLITNTPIEARGKLGIAYTDVRPHNPRLIYASFTGYGETGPDVNQLGFDSTAFFARSGLFDCNRYEGQPPGVAMPGQGDRASGMTLLAGILLALIRRGQTGLGSEVKSSLLANGLWSNGVGAQAALLGAFLPPRPPRDRPRSALTNLYRTEDDRWIQLTIVREEKCWPDFLAAVGRPDLASDPRFAETAERRKNSGALTAILDPIFAGQPFAHWRGLLIEHGIPFGLIGRLQDLAGDAQAVACGAVVEGDHPGMPRTLAAPFTITGMAARRPAAAPDLGADTDSVLREIGYGSADIAALRRAGTVA
jgi:formyl-CoA transferase